MDRVIKFRGKKDIFLGSWVFGYLVIANGEVSIHNDDGVFPIIAGTEG